MMLNDIHNSLIKQFEKSDSLQRMTGTETDQKRLMLGKVLRFISGEFAEIQIGNTKWQGKLETPLAANTYYWFSYEKKPGEQTGRLQVVEAFDKNPKTMQEAAVKLLNGLSLKRTKEALFLVGSLLKEQQPIRENDLKAAVKWLENLPKAEAQKGADAVMFALKRELPVHPGVLNSILAVKEPVPLHNQIAKAFDMISREPQQTAGLEKLKQALLSIIQAETDVQGEKVVQALRELAGAAAKEPQQTAQPLRPAVAAERDFPQQMPPFKPAGAETAAVQPKSQGPEAAAAEGLLAKLAAQAEQNGTHAVKEAVNWIKAAEAKQPLRLPAGLGALSEKEAEILQNIIRDTAPSLTNKADVLSLLIKTKDLFGVKDELTLMKAIENGGALKDQGLHSLKMVLNEARHSQELSAPLKQEAEQMFHRLNGQLFLQQDQSAQSQLFLSYPLFSKHGVQDLTVFLKGKKKDDGKIDPSQCRLMFYLQLEGLKETVVDCFIQQNVMTVSIETGFDLEPLIEPLIPRLKENLKELGYSLSSVTAKKRESLELAPFLEREFEQAAEGVLDVKI
ncbi:hypothetical protein P9D51_20805 [Bacillus sonorensis]|uniref:hypothetical protein n=2 Tax=Bacillus sonorensis TaxID=119858 RepID=UPI0018CFA5AE|nr:hypothetical protein [Bacillus sonorensis]MBG9917289.1 hypothetical protein [Bacillus sonorensis]MCY7855252.1 hypothetical protein [Bacillus sonorensis]MCY8024888.1 hypothetical protein [Bacillus sonorensis]MCY8032122.1 hypothetical protein [Bacillus sonorensis]MCY8405895.1 hypothetical protein [Bacillus sonorensis]